ncbi:MAG TPA: ferritin-like domain-containing protein [Polyangiaceae bacterium]|jgi:bacterioferritin (cytochrome b1)
MNTAILRENERWLLSFYRTSEINGALFFGRLARAMRPGPIQADMTQHFADESAHASYWTVCLGDLGTKAIKLDHAYQDDYLEAGGMPANMMEVLAVTLAFERRVIRQYVQHSRVPELAAPVKDTLTRIMSDEKWHIRWVTAALESMEEEYGADTVRSTLQRYVDADKQVYRDFLQTNAEMLREMTWLAEG